MSPVNQQNWENTKHFFLHSRIALPALLSIGFFLALFYSLHAIPLFDLDEGAFTEATREMLASGNYVTTYLNGELRFDKPILIYWLQAISASLFGINEFGFRLPSVLAAIGWMLAIKAFTEEHADRTTGFVAAILGVTTLGVGVIGRAAIADALLNFFLVLTMFDVYRYMEKPEKKYRYRAYLWMGFGLLTKGPIAILIPFVVSAIVFTLQGKWRIWLRAMFDPVGWAILLAVAAPWYVLEYLDQGQKFIDGFFLRHNVERFQSPMEGHSGSILFYVPALLLLILPYSGLFISVLPTLRKIRQDSLTAFLWVWFLFVLIFFSLGGTKLPHYLLYGVTPLFILMAIHRESLKSRWLAFVPPLFLAGLALALPALLKQAASRSKNAYFEEMLSQQIFGAGYYAAGAGVLLLMFVCIFLPRTPLWSRLAATGFVSAFIVSALILPSIAQLQQGPVKEAALIAKQIGGPVSSFGINMPSFSVYRESITKRYRTSQADAPQTGLIFTRVDKLDKLGPVETIYRKGGIALVRPLP